jgi:hypothetical protein
VARPRSGPGANGVDRPTPRRRRPQPRHRQPLRSRAPGEEAALQPRRRRPRGGLRPSARAASTKPAAAGVDHARQCSPSGGRRTGRTGNPSDLSSRSTTGPSSTSSPASPACSPEGAHPRRAGQRGGLSPRPEPAAAAGPRTVEPSRLSFRERHSLDLCQRFDFVSQWASSISRSVETGSCTQALPSAIPPRPTSAASTTQGRCARDRQLCYSAMTSSPPGSRTTDRSGARRQQQHGRRANVWDHAATAAVPGAQQPVRALPKGTSFRVAIRQVAQAGPAPGRRSGPRRRADQARHDPARPDRGQRRPHRRRHRPAQGQPERALLATVGAVSRRRRPRCHATGIDRVGVARGPAAHERRRRRPR